MNRESVFSEASQLASLGIWEWNIQTDELRWQQGYRQLFGIDDPDHLTMRDAWYIQVHPEEREEVKNSLLQAIAQNAQDWYAEYRCLKNNGSYLWVREKARIHHDEAGKPTHAVGIIMDISLQKEISEDLQNRNRELVKTIEVLDNFVYTVAHDLKSPVANLKFLIQLLQNTEPSDKRKEITGMINTSITRLDQTIDGLVEIVQVQSDRLSETDITFEHVFEHVRASFAEDIEKAKAILRTDFRLAPDIRFTEVFLTGILRNLISNALKYRAEGRRLEVDIKTRREGKDTLLIVSDNGIGIDLNKYENQLFKPFHRFTQQANGKGIGLYLVKCMVEKNGGRIDVGSELTQGTTFTIFLKSEGI